MTLGHPSRSEWEGGRWGCGGGVVYCIPTLSWNTIGTLQPTLSTPDFTLPLYENGALLLVMPSLKQEWMVQMSAFLFSSLDSNTFGAPVIIFGTRRVGVGVIQKESK